MENVARQSPWRRARCLFRSLRTAWPNNTPHPALPFYLREYAWCHPDQTDSFSPQIQFGLSVQSCVSAVEWLGLCQQIKGDERNDWYSRSNQQDTDNNSKVLCANLSRWRLKVFSGLKVSLLSDVQGQDKLFKTLDWWVTGSSFLWTC